jgi:hypothetical protein
MNNFSLEHDRIFLMWNIIYIGQYGGILILRFMPTKNLVFHF